MKTKELTHQGFTIPTTHKSYPISSKSGSDTLILALIFIIGLLGICYILNGTSSSSSTINSQGYTIEYSSFSH